MSTRSTTLFIALAVLLGLVLGSAPALAQGPPADAIDLSQVGVYNSPPDIASWPVTTAITRLDMQRPNGLFFTFSARTPGRLRPARVGRGLQSLRLGGGEDKRPVVSSGFIRCGGSAKARAPDPDGFCQELGTTRWGPMMGHQPVVGEQMGFFVSSGNARASPRRRPCGSGRA